jgi:general stress protein YciG
MTTRAEVNEAARMLGRRGGQARVANQTPEQRRESARHASRARWARVRAGISEETTVIGHDAAVSN